MADAAVTYLLQKTEEILKYYYNLLTGAEAELKNLENDLRKMKAFLTDTAQIIEKPNTIKETERQIRDAVYEAEDTIDTCLTQAAKEAAAATATTTRKKGRVKTFFSSSSKSTNISTKISMAEQVQSLRAKLIPSLNEVDKLIASGSVVKGKQPSTGVPKVQSIRQDKIVGFEDEEKTLVNYLTEPTKKLEVIAITGIPGQGKTTLASKIFHKNQSIQYKFPKRIWVYASQDFNLRNLLLNILKEFTNQDMSGMSDPSLFKTVRDHLETSNFLLVIDDVWTVENWIDIRNVLPMNNELSKVLITSRLKNVGAYASSSKEHCHELRFLTKEESWELLQLEVFEEVDKCHEKLKHKGELIAKQCDGLPLAIVVIGGILKDIVSKNKEMINQILDSWDDVSKNVSTYIKNNEVYDIFKIVAMSYNNLRAELRECFVYLAVFPEDYEIPVWTLTRLWIAEGFIENKEGQTLEKTAEENLNHLIDMNLVMVGKTNPNHKLKTCCVHDVIREFCISKAVPKEHDLFQEIKKSNGVFNPPLSDRQTYHRLCIHSNLQDFFSKIQPKKVEFKGVRSILCFNDKSFLLDPKFTPIIPDKFESLRVLDSNSFKFKQLPLELNKLIHMRYLTLSIDADLDSLPKTIYDLWNLQTLVIDSKSGKLEINANIWKMYRLRHLKTKAAIVLDLKEEPAGTAGENLQTLSRLTPQCCTKEVFSRAQNITRLGVRGSIETLFESSSLEKLNLLEDLKLVNELDYGEASENPLQVFPSHKWFRNIKKLTLSATYLEWTHMSTLGKIATLQVLKLKDNAFKGSDWIVDGGFGKLQFLLISGTDLFFWGASDDQFPSLTGLVLKNCQKLNEIPLGLAKSLRTLEIERVPKSAEKSAKEIGEQAQDKQKSRFKLIVGAPCE